MSLLLREICCSQGRFVVVKGDLLLLREIAVFKGDLLRLTALILIFLSGNAGRSQ